MHALENTSISIVPWNNIFKRINLILNSVLPQDQFLFVPRHVETIKNIFLPSPCKKKFSEGFKNLAESLLQQKWKSSLSHNHHTALKN